MNSEISSVEKLVDTASLRYTLGDYDGGISSLKQALSISPDDGYLHSFLSLGLLNKKRIEAALYEAQIGLKLAPNSAYSYYVLARLEFSKRHYKSAEEYIKKSISIEPDDQSILILLIEIQIERKNFDQAEKNLDKALEIYPLSPSVFGLFGDYWAKRNNHNKAEYFYSQVLSIEPHNLHSLIGKGYILLKKGDVKEAKQHAIWALHQEPSNEGALMLLSGIKTKQNKFMGTWWSLNTWLSCGSDTRAITLMVLFFILFNFSSVALEDAGLLFADYVVKALWFSIVIYMWVAPTWFNKEVKKELAPVSLSKDF